MGRIFLRRLCISCNKSVSKRTSMKLVYLLEASMASQNPSLHPVDLLPLHADETETHLQEHVLHSEIGGHAAHADLRCRSAFSLAGLIWHKVERTRLVQGDIRGGNPFTFAIVFV